MCGLVGIASNKLTVSLLLECLEKLEYRGYDSAGASLLTGSRDMLTRKAIGPISKLRKVFAEGEDKKDRQAYYYGIAHTRWATHGSVSLENAHPQSDGHIAVVHNGIIENFAELKVELLRQFPDTYFSSQTDTEIVVHMISRRISQGQNFFQAFQETLSQLKGSFALLVLNKDNPDSMLMARRNSPLVIGQGEGLFKGDFFVASDVLAISPYISSTFDLHDDEIGLIHKESNKLSGKTYNFSCSFFNLQGNRISKEARTFKKTEFSLEKGNFDDFTSKEIMQQPKVIQGLIDLLKSDAYTEFVQNHLHEAQTLRFVGCGSSFYAGKIGGYLFEKYANLSATSEIASEFRYRDPVLLDRCLSFFISQSGETIDTLCALDYVKGQKDKILPTVVLTNSPQSSMAQRADTYLSLHAGPEFGVVSTKAFTAQLTLLVCLLIEHLKQKPLPIWKDLLTDLESVPDKIGQINALMQNISFSPLTPILEKLNTAKSVLFIGRGLSSSVALECALKFKEISYIHAEGYPAGELKHGPLALISEEVVTVVLVPYDDLFEKTLSNVQEIIARNGFVILLTDEKGAAFAQRQELRQDQISFCLLPETGPISKVFAYSAAGQWIAYHMAKLRQCNIDRPRNLAKAVTVE